jgi:hypothetical protein
MKLNALAKVALAVAVAFIGFRVLANLNSGIAKACVASNVAGNYETFYNRCDYPIVAEVCRTYPLGGTKCATERFGPGDTVALMASDTAPWLIQAISPTRVEWRACKLGRTPMLKDGGRYSCRRA